ncbi:hypothetical protein [Truepera radiovictrix]|nr:hypothetical protein [Truepera radiovictrix]
MLVLNACSSGIQQDPPAGEPGLELSTQAATSHNVPNSASDAEEWNGVTYTMSPVLELGYKDQSTGLAQTTGVRFSGVSIPRGATITSAYIDFTAVTSQSDATSLRIHGQNVGSGGPFVEGASNGVTGRVKTSNSVTWSPEPWTGGFKYSTPNLAPIVREITSRSDWVQGAAMVFIIKGTGQRKAHAFDAGNNLQPVLRVTYQTSLRTCLPSKPTEVLSGVYNSSLKRTGNGETALSINAVSAKIAPVFTELGPLARLRYYKSLCLSGGVYTLNEAADPEVKGDDSSWEKVFHRGTVGVEFWDSPSTVIEQVAIELSGDGISPRGYKNHNWLIRDSYIRHAGDDGVENDWMTSGTIDGVLIDWAYTGISCRAGESQRNDLSSITPGTITIKNSLIRLRKQKWGYNNATNLHNHLFKWEQDQPDKGYVAKKGCKLRLINNVFMVDQNAGYLDPAQNPKVNYGQVLVESSNNILIWSGPESALPNSYKQANLPSGFTLKMGSEGASIWNTRRNQWFDYYKQFGLFQNYRTFQKLY